MMSEHSLIPCWHLYISSEVFLMMMMMQIFSKWKLMQYMMKKGMGECISDCGSTSVYIKKYMKFSCMNFVLKNVALMIVNTICWICLPPPHHSGRYQLLFYSLFVCFQWLFVQFYLSFWNIGDFNNQYGLGSKVYESL
jgi:hypothetical protein